MDTISELLRFYERFDAKKKWLVDPDEAVEITLASAESHLTQNTINDYIQYVLQALEDKAYERGEGQVGSGLNSLQEQELFDILSRSEFCERKSGKIDLSNAKEITLSDGRIIPINPPK